MWCSIRCYDTLSLGAVGAVSRMNLNMVGTDGLSFGVKE